ncbi:MAG: HAD-IB family hydrolase [Actinomycetota bacterium]|nr:HAD-IB family hydrolase [Actinomycetota bacterium]
MTSEPARPGPVGVAAFDFDGTLIAGDSFLPFLIRLVGRRAMGRAFVVAGPELLTAFARGSRDATKAAMLGRLLAGYPEPRIVELGAAYADQLVRQIRPAMAQRIDWHRSQGHRLVIVSASLEVYLAPTGRLLGFDQVLATRLEVGPSGRLTGRLAGVNVRRAEKSARLRQWLAAELDQAPHELWAYGDSTGDRELLAMADHPMRV